MESKPTVYLVDDDPAILRVLAELVELIELKAECYRSANEFLKTYKPTGPACLVLDVRMPGMSGLELQKELVKSDITLPIIMITGHGDVRMAVEAMSAGALNLLEKPFRTQELCDNIQQAIRIAEERWQHRRQREEFNSLMADLTPAEREVLDLVLAGKTNKMIAEQLGLSVRAIEDRRGRMMKKLGATNRPCLLELVAAADPS